MQHLIPLLESADNFTYTMFAAGSVYMLCDMMERYSQMQSLGGNFQDFKSEFWKDKKETILNSTFAAIGAVGTIAFSQTSPDKAESDDTYKQVPMALLAGVASFLYLQSSKAIERVSEEKRTQLHEREIAEPFEKGITDAINILNGQQPQQPQGQNNTFISPSVSQLHMVAQNKVSELSMAHKEIADLKQSIAERNKDISDLTQERDQLLDQETILRLDNESKNQIIVKKDEEITKLSVDRKGAWQERVNRNIEGRDRGNSI